MTLTSTLNFRLATIALAACTTLAGAQTKPAHAITLGGNYTYTRSNLVPGCSCFSLKGGGAQAEFGLSPHVSLLADANVVHKGGITPDGYTLNQFTYTAGVRYSPVAAHRLRPFAEVTVGGASAKGSLSPASTGFGSGSNAFAFEAGGGISLRVSPRIALMPIQADYLMTRFNNGADNLQNDLRLSTGIVFRLRR